MNSMENQYQAVTGNTERSIYSQHNITATKKLFLTEKYSSKQIVSNISKLFLNYIVKGQFF